MSLLTQLHVLLLTPETSGCSFTSPLGRLKQRLLGGGEHGFSPDLEDLPRLFLSVRRGGDDEQAIQQVNGDAMGALIVCATDPERKKNA